MARVYERGCVKVFRRLFRANFPYLFAQIALDAVLLILGCLAPIRKHAPWVILATATILIGWIVLLGLLLDRMCEVSQCNCKQFFKNLVDHDVFGAETMTGLIASTTLTADAVWTVSYALSHVKGLTTTDPKSDEGRIFSPFDIWVPVAIATQIAVMSLAARDVDSL